MTDNPLAYVLRPYNYPSDMTLAAHLTCSKCGDGGKIKIGGIGNNPEKIEKLFIRMGWDCVVHNKRKCVCPRCVRQREIRLKDEEKKPIPMKVLPAVVAAAPAHFPETTVHTAIEKALTKMAQDPKGISIKTLTPDQKTALRNELGGTFDEIGGRFLEGNSDRKISEKLGIPMITVIEFRENFYGELKEDPVVAQYKRELSEAKMSLAAIQSTVNKLEARLEEVLARLKP